MRSRARLAATLVALSVAVLQGIYWANVALVLGPPDGRVCWWAGARGHLVPWPQAPPLTPFPVFYPMDYRDGAVCAVYESGAFIAVVAGVTLAAFAVAWTVARFLALHGRDTGR